jgi:hypothetical protein
MLMTTTALILLGVFKIFVNAMKNAKKNVHYFWRSEMKDKPLKERIREILCEVRGLKLENGCACNIASASCCYKKDCGNSLQAILTEIKGSLPSKINEDDKVLLPTHIALNHDPKAVKYYVADEKCRRQGYNAYHDELEKLLE